MSHDRAAPRGHLDELEAALRRQLPETARVSTAKVRGDLIRVVIRAGDGSWELSVTRAERPDEAFLRGSHVAVAHAGHVEADAMLPDWVVAAAELIASPEHARLADLLVVEDRSLESIETASLVDLVRQGLKPAARLSYPEHRLAQARQHCEGLALRVSSFSVGDAGTTEKGRRFFYVARERWSVDRLHQIDLQLRSKWLLPSTTRGLCAEQGRLFGYPECCIEAFRRRPFGWPWAPGGVSEDYLWLRVMGCERETVEPELNFLAAGLYRMPVLTHLPCSAHCRPTIDASRRRVQALYTPFCRQIVEEQLGTSFVVWPEGGVLPFRWIDVSRGETGATEVGALTYPDLATEAARNRWVRLASPEVDRLRVRFRLLEARGPAGWRVAGPMSPASVLRGGPMLVRFGACHLPGACDAELRG